LAQDSPHPTINRLKELLKTGKPAVGAMVVMPTAASVELLAALGFDWVLIDSEHGPIDIETVHHMVRATNGTSTAPIVRVTWNLDWLAKRALDVGAMGILMPFVNSKDEAVRAVRALKYPPEGDRGFGPLFAAPRWGMSLPEYMKAANNQVLAMVQIEHIDAVRQIDDILSVPGIDVAFIGPYDLSGSIGLLGQVGHPKVQEAIDTVLAAAKRARVPLGIFATTPEEINKRIEQGFQVVLVGVDAMFLTAGAKSLIGQIKR